MARARLVQAFDLFRHLVPLEHAERLDQLERYAACNAGHVLGSDEGIERAEQLLHMRLDPEVEARLHRIARSTGKLLVGRDPHARAQHILAGDDPADRVTRPADAAIGREHELFVGRLREPRGAGVDFARERATRGSMQRLCLRSGSRGISGKAKAFKPPDDMALHHDLAGFLDLGFEHRVFSQSPHQHAGTAIDEPLGETLVQGIGKLVLDGTRYRLPVLGIGQPVRSVGSESPGPDMGDPRRKSIDPAIGMVGLRHLLGEPVDRNSTLPHQKSIEGDRELGVGRGRNLTIVRHLADVPQALDRRARRRHRAHLVVAGGVFEHQNVFGDRRARETALRRARQRASPAARPSETKSSSLLRHCMTLMGSNAWLSSACTSSVSNGGQRPVVPNVPSRVARPARPAIWANSAGLSRRNW